MELVEHNTFPRLFNLGTFRLGLCKHGGEHVNLFRINQLVFSLTVELFDLGICAVTAACVVLKILAYGRNSLALVFTDMIEVSVNTRIDSLAVRNELFCLIKMLDGRSATVVTYAEKYHLRTGKSFISLNTLVLDISAVAVINMVRKNLASVRAFPIMYRVIGKIFLFRLTARSVVNIILHSCLFKKLRKHTVVTEGVNIVARIGYLAEILLIKSLRIEKMSDKGLSARNVTVGLNPHSACVFPASLFNSLLDLLEHLRLAELYPLVIGSAGRIENVVRVLNHSVKSRTEG